MRPHEQPGQVRRLAPGTEKRPDAQPPSNRVKTVEPDHYQEALIQMKTSTQSSQERHPDAPAGFVRQHFAPDGSPHFDTMAELNKDVHLYRGKIIEVHGLSIEQFWEPETGIYYQLHSEGMENLTRDQLTAVMGAVCVAYLWETDHR